MGIAMAVASGRADVGLGIMAAANALELDFIPVTRERYDIVIPCALKNTENIARMLDLIHSPEFHRQVQGLGGYDLDETGKLVIL